MSVDPENVPKVLGKVREFIKDHLLPRIFDLEEEVKLLRRATWPICQNVREHNQLDDIEFKRKFLQNLDPEEVQLLLKLKSKGLLVEEYNRLKLPTMRANYH